MLILCPTDFSEIAVGAADVAGLLARRRVGGVRLVHSLSSWIHASEAPISGMVDDFSSGQLEAEAERLRAAGVRVDVLLRYGSASGEVAAAVAEASVDMIVLGSGDPAAGHHLAGSVAERVAEAVPVPTLVVRQPQPLRGWLQDDAPLRTLCAVDFSPSSDAALAALASLKDGGPVAVDVVHFARPADAAAGQTATPSPDVREQIRRHVESFLGASGFTVQIYADDGHAPEFLSRLARETGADLIVIGTRQIHGLRRLLSPSFSRGVLTHASANVLCVPVAAGAAAASSGEPRL